MNSVDGVFRFIAYLFEWNGDSNRHVLLIFGDRRLELRISRGGE